MAPDEGFRPAQLEGKQRRRLGVLRTWTQLRRPRSLLALLALADVGVAIAVGLWTGSLLLTVLALLPLLLAPALGWLAYWLVWQDFHR